MDLQDHFQIIDLNTWQQTDDPSAGEEFADMFIGWVYNQWEASINGGWSLAGQARASFMDEYMPPWVWFAYLYK